MERAGDHPDPEVPGGVGEERGELPVDRLRLGLALGRAEVVDVLGQHGQVGAGRRRPAPAAVPAAARLAARSARELTWHTATLMAAE